MKILSLDTSSRVCSVAVLEDDNVYFGLFEKNGTSFTQIGNLCGKNINDIIELLTEYKTSPILFIGDGSKVHKNVLLQHFKNANFADDVYNIQTSESVGKAGFNHFKQGLFRRFKLYKSFIFKKISSRTCFRR